MEAFTIHFEDSQHSFNSKEDTIMFLKELDESYHQKKICRISVNRNFLEDLIWVLRKYNNLTQTELGERINYPFSIISQIERGKRQLGLKTLVNIIDAFDLKIKISIDL